LHPDLTEHLSEIDMPASGEHVGMLSAEVALDGGDLGVAHVLRRGNWRSAAEACEGVG
jgi:hypothetical protein